MRIKEKNSNAFAIFIILLIVVGIIIGIIFPKKTKTNIVENNTVVNEVKNDKVNEIKNEVKEKNETENTEVENTIENTAIENTETKTETFTEKPKTEEEKAIAIVKKDYGESDGIGFSIQGMDQKGRQIVVVSRGTSTLAFYKVNVSDGTFDKQIIY